jgi:hypothetical protein
VNPKDFERLLKWCDDGEHSLVYDATVKSVFRDMASQLRALLAAEPGEPGSDGAALNAIYQIATRALAESHKEDTRALVEICDVCETRPAPAHPPDGLREEKYPVELRCAELEEALKCSEALLAEARGVLEGARLFIDEGGHFEWHEVSKAYPMNTQCKACSVVRTIDALLARIPEVPR